jgi:predicted Zn-dependent protease
MANYLNQAIEQFPFSKYPEVEWIGLREVKEVTTERSIRDGKPQTNDSHESHGVMIEVLVNGQFGYSATVKRDLESLLAQIEVARLQALQSSRFSVFSFSVDQRPKVTSKYSSPFLKPFGSMSAGEMNELLIQITNQLKISPKIIRTEAVARMVETEVHFVSSNGSDAEQKFSLITTDFQATAQDGSIVQRRTDGGMRGKSYQGGLEHLLTKNLWERVNRVATEALELVSAEQCPTKTTSLVLMPSQMMLQIHESIGHPLEIDRILGDERNYAGWSFVSLEDFGKLQYGSHLMNVSFDPTVSHEFASYAFDDNGTLAEREYLIKDGVLIRGLGGIESQARSKIKGVANARASSWNRPPIDRMANLNLEPGESTFEEMISSVEDGILMDSNRSWSIDDFRNKFQFGCEYGRLIKNGKLGAVVRNPNYRGVTVPFWRSLKKVGDSATREVYGTPNCGKGEPNQVIRVGHASPVCLFENVEVFGGAL